MSCKTVLPINIDEAINLLDIAGCEKFSSLKESIEKIKSFNNALEIDEKHLALLVDEYDAGFFREFEPDARKLVRFAQRNYPKLGTLGATKKVFETLKINAEVKEWFNTGKEPFVFDIDLSLVDKEITPNLIIKIKKLIDISKNVRSYLDELILSYKSSTSFYIKAGGMGEAGCNAKMIDGFTNYATASAFAVTIGAVGETVAVAKMEV